jgi:hypothetical protein
VLVVMVVIMMVVAMPVPVVMATMIMAHTAMIKRIYTDKVDQKSKNRHQQELVCFDFWRIKKPLDCLYRDGKCCIKQSCTVEESSENLNTPKPIWQK